MERTNFNEKPHARVHSRLSQQQKAMLYRFMHQNPNLKDGKFTLDFTQHKAQRLWSKIAIKLNNVPGARKTWLQWRKVA